MVWRTGHKSVASACTHVATFSAHASPIHACDLRRLEDLSADDRATIDSMVSEARKLSAGGAALAAAAAGEHLLVRGTCRR